MRLPIYFDYMATTPVDPRVADKMQQFLTLEGVFANPSSSHLLGDQAAQAVETARQQVAELIHAKPIEIIFTSGATEAINLALKGAAQSYQRKGKHIITWQTEHKAVLSTCKALEQQGFTVTYLPVQKNGLIDLELLKQTIQPDTILVSLLAVSNEIGVIQDIASVGRLTREKGIVFHVDGVQAAGKILLDVQAMQIDLMSFSAHKAYGPKGIGALFVNQNPRIVLMPQTHGATQERSLRPGTLPVHQIAAMGEAFALAKNEFATEIPRLKALHERLWSVLSTVDGVQLNGDVAARVPHNVNIAIAGVQGEALQATLKDLALSSSSACNSHSLEASHVLRALGLPDNLAHGSLRISFGRFTTEEEIDYAANYLRKVITQLRGLSPAGI